MRTKRWKNQAGLEAAARPIAGEFPDDLETLTLMVDSAVERDQPDQAMSYVQKARALEAAGPANSKSRSDQFVSASLASARSQGAGTKDANNSGRRQELAPSFAVTIPSSPASASSRRRPAGATRATDSSEAAGRLARADAALAGLAIESIPLQDDGRDHKGLRRALDCRPQEESARARPPARWLRC